MPTLPERHLTILATFHLHPEKNIDEMAPLYAEDVHFVDPFHDIRGREAVLRMNRNLVKRFKEMRFDDLALVGGEPHFMLSWTATIQPKIGPAVIAPGVAELKTQGGLVVYHRDHWDVLSTFTGSIPVVGTVYRKITERIFG